MSLSSCFFNISLPAGIFCFDNMGGTGIIYCIISIPVGPVKMKSGVMAGYRCKIFLRRMVQSGRYMIKAGGYVVQQPRAPGYVHTKLLCGDVPAGRPHFVAGRLHGVFGSLPVFSLSGQAYFYPIHARPCTEYCGQSGLLPRRISQGYPAMSILRIRKQRR